MASGSIPPKEAPNWLELPRDITENIFHRLGAFEVFTITRNVCSLWWKICMDPLMWRTVDMSSDGRRIFYRDPICLFAPFFTGSRHREKACRYIVCQIRGHLEAISIAYFATDDHLKVIASCASLRSLDIKLHRWGEEISDVGLLAILDGCPLLESLYLRNISFLIDEELSTSLLKRCKKQIKDFKVYDDRGYSDDSWDLDYELLFRDRKKS